MQLLQQQTTLQNRQFPSFNTTIHCLLHTARGFVLTVFNYTFKAKVLLLLTIVVPYVQILQSIVKLNSNAMVIPGGGDWQYLLRSHQQCYSDDNFT